METSDRRACKTSKVTPSGPPPFEELRGEASGLVAGSVLAISFTMTSRLTSMLFLTCETASDITGSSELIGAKSLFSAKLNDLMPSKTCSVDSLIFSDNLGNSLKTPSKLMLPPCRAEVLISSENLVSSTLKLWMSPFSAISKSFKPSKTLLVPALTSCSTGAKSMGGTETSLRLSWTISCRRCMASKIASVRSVWSGASCLPVNRPKNVFLPPAVLDAWEAAFDVFLLPGNIEPKPDCFSDLSIVYWVGPAGTEWTSAFFELSLRSILEDLLEGGSARDRWAFEVWDKTSDEKKSARTCPPQSDAPAIRYWTATCALPVSARNCILNAPRRSLLKALHRSPTSQSPSRRPNQQARQRPSCNVSSKYRRLSVFSPTCAHTVNFPCVASLSLPP
mmetsp:Transcript_53951/g.115195  ORF Transcript_53951/g.115195 Transcript_53951/m.115195 type:complete len:393 (-) Transcript_53951:8-1186(-)